MKKGGERSEDVGMFCHLTYTCNTRPAKRRHGQKGRLHKMDSFPGIVCLFWHLAAQNVEKKL